MPNVSVTWYWVPIKYRIQYSVSPKCSMQYILTIRIRVKIRITLSFEYRFRFNQCVVGLCNYSVWIYQCMYAANTRQAVNFCLYSVCKAVWRIHRGHVLDKVKDRSFVLVPLWQICSYGGIWLSTRVKCIIQIEVKVNKRCSEKRKQLTAYHTCFKSSYEQGWRSLAVKEHFSGHAYAHNCRCDQTDPSQHIKFIHPPSYLGTHRISCVLFIHLQTVRVSSLLQLWVFWPWREPMATGRKPMQPQRETCKLLTARQHKTKHLFVVVAAQSSECALVFMS